MKYLDWAAFCALVVTLCLFADAPAFASCGLLGAGCPAPAPLLGVGPLASGAVAVVGGGYAYLRNKFRY
jgi:hypothetical protein